MVRIIDWAASHARMILASIILSLAVGVTSYFTLPKEGAPDIEFPGFFISVPYGGISAEDSEKLLVRPLEDKLSNLDGLEYIQSTAAEGYAGIFLQFEFGLDNAKTLADIRDKVSQAETEFPQGASESIISEFSFSDFPIVIVILSGNLPERTMQTIAEALKNEVEALPAVLEVGLTGQRSEMIEVIINPLQLEAYNVSASELIAIVTRNNQLIAAGEFSTDKGAFSVKIPSSFKSAQDIYLLPIKVNGDRIVTLGDLAEINMTFEDRAGIARHNGKSTVALQVIKRKGFNIIDSVDEVRQKVDDLQSQWPKELKNSLQVDYVQDVSSGVQSMVTQLESSVLTAVSLVMVVVLATLGIRSALLVGFAIPSSFLLCFTLLAILGIPISNMVMFGLILAVGMLVDSAIVVVELADRKISEGSRPMVAYVDAAKRMFWPIISSTATTLCAFLPMLFWPGIPGQFMGVLPVTLIFVLSASLLVALIFLPVVGGIVGRIGMRLRLISNFLMNFPWIFRLSLTLVLGIALFAAALVFLNPAFLFGDLLPIDTFASSVPGAILFVIVSLGLSVTTSSLRGYTVNKPSTRKHRRNLIVYLIKFIVGNPIMPVVAIATTALFVAGVFQLYSQNNLGVTFFVETEPERAMINVLARGNMSLDEKDKLVREIENDIIGIEGISSVFTTTGEGGINNQASGGPADTIGKLQLEFDLWEDRQKLDNFATDTRKIIEQIENKLNSTPGIKIDIQTEASGPEQGKPLSLRLSGNNWAELLEATSMVRKKFSETKALVFIDDTLPLPGIDWQIDIDVEKAGRFGTDVATVGAMIQLVTRGILLDTMRLPTSDQEVDIRVRFPEQYRVLSTLTNLRLRTPSGLVPLSNFVTIRPVKQLSEISRYNQERFINVNANIKPGLRNEDGRPITPTDRIEHLTDWLQNEAELPISVSWKWTGDQEEQAESQTFLMYAFIGALGLMFAVLLAQFNSFYNSVLVLFAVILSTTGVLIGMLVMQQPFSIIMTGTGIVSLAGIVVNNNIVLIDTYMEYAAYMPKIEAIIRTVEVRLRPVLLTSITTIAGLTPMMFGWSINIVDGGYTLDTPTSLWWKQLATAVVFGLGTATILTLIITPSFLAIRVWVNQGSYRFGRLVGATLMGRNSRLALDSKLYKTVANLRDVNVSWDQLQNVLLPVYPARQEYALQNNPTYNLPSKTENDIFEINPSIYTQTDNQQGIDDDTNYKDAGDQ